jgi:protease IV
MTAFPGPHADYVIDRRRLRRKVTFWRVFAFVLALLAIGAIWLRATSTGIPGPGAAHIARVEITGLITGDRKTLELLEKIGKSKASAVLLSIESPGGTTTGSERLFEEIRLLSQKKPVVAVVGTVAASGAYIAALGADRIFARKNSLVGSIGVLAQIPNVSQLMGKLGVSMEVVRSAPLKAAPNSFEPTSPEARKAMQDIIADSYSWFKELVKTRRNLNDGELVKVADGRVFTGQQGIGLKLVDAIGGEREAIAWLEKEKNLPEKLRIRDWKTNENRSFGWLRTAAALFEFAGFTQFALALRQAQNPADAGILDGLLAVWQSKV